MRETEGKWVRSSKVTCHACGTQIPIPLSDFLRQRLFIGYGEDFMREVEYTMREHYQKMHPDVVELWDELQQELFMPYFKANLPIAPGVNDYYQSIMSQYYTFVDSAMPWSWSFEFMEPTR